MVPSLMIRLTTTNQTQLSRPGCSPLPPGFQGAQGVRGIVTAMSGE